MQGQQGSTGGFDGMPYPYGLIFQDTEQTMESMVEDPDLLGMENGERLLPDIQVHHCGQRQRVLGLRRGGNRRMP